MTTMTKERIGKVSFQAEVGLLLRKQVRFQLEVYAKKAGLRLELMENKGWLDSQFYIELHGVESKVLQAKSDLDAWFAQLEHI